MPHLKVFVSQEWELWAALASISNNKTLLLLAPFFGWLAYNIYVSHPPT
jgi:hypothetical protein